MGNRYNLERRNGSIHYGFTEGKKNFVDSSSITTFVLPCRSYGSTGMKYSEFHRKVKVNGWRHIRSEGSHYIYEKYGRTYPVPFHGAKEIGEGLRKKIIKEMGLM